MSKRLTSECCKKGFIYEKLQRRSIQFAYINLILIGTLEKFDHETWAYDIHIHIDVQNVHENNVGNK